MPLVTMGSCGRPEAGSQSPILPDGFCHGTLINANFSPDGSISEKRAAVRNCSYIGSFAVSGEDHDSRAEYVRSKLELMKDRKQSKTVLIVISLTGIKLCNPDTNSVQMAHALRRISYATCDPQHCLFAFIAREPKGHFSLQYCHTFQTTSSQQAEDLNSLVGNAFRLAFAKQIDQDRNLPSFNSLVDKQIQQDRRVLSSTAPSNTNDIYQTSSECSEETYGQRQQHINNNNAQPNLAHKPKANVKHKLSPFRRLWAKNNKVQHKEPVLDRITEMSGLPSGNNRIGFQKSTEMTVFQFEDNSRQKTNFECNQTMPSTPPNSLRLCSPRNGTLAGSSSPSPSDSVSSDDNNVSTLYNNFNSAELDKLPMVKKVSVLCDKVVGINRSDKKQEDPDLLACSIVRNRTVAHCSRSLVIPVSQPSYNQSTIYNDAAANNLSGKESNGSSESMLISFEDVSKKTCDLNNKDQKAPVQPADLGSAVRQAKLPTSNNSPIILKNKKIKRDTNNLLHNNEINNMKRGNRCETKYNNSVVVPPPLPERYDSLATDGQYDEDELKCAPWFQAGIPREIALEILSKEPVGAFMVRESTTRPDCFALSLRVPFHFQPTGISHYLILSTNKGYKIKGFTKEFSTLTSLITHHSVMPELLPCPLSLSRYNANFSRNDSRNSEDTEEDDDPDYETLSDFRKMMSDLNV